MGHAMYEYNPELAEAVFAYCRDRMSMSPIPLDLGGLAEVPDAELATLIQPGGRRATEVLDFFQERLAPAVISIDSPTFLAFIPNAPTKSSLLFDMVVACSGLNGTSWLESAGVVAAENCALDLLSRRAGLPAGSGGAFVSGGSMGNLSGLTVGRDVGCARVGIEPHRARFALSGDAHSSVGKALHVLGVGSLVVESDDHRLTAERLAGALDADPDPRSVVGVIATAGTTNAGIVDDLEGIGALARERDLWYHVDGAYGGAAMFSPTQSHLFAGLRHADSFVVDPHKWLLAPLDCAALLYRNPTVARRVLAQQAGYLDVLHAADDESYEWNPSDFAIHLSRRARGLPFWFSLATHGTDAYESAIQAAIDMARYAADTIAASDHLELVREPTLSIVLFRRRGWEAPRYTQWSYQMLRDQLAFVTPTKWEGETVGRLAFLHPNTTRADVDAIVESARVF
ncbi:MAG TPA: pyridoxal-dependent decarboxylase [Acidimicrobiales bacterium]|nr:pyridoxal-dependent decarboxylase [Acidimicrobiales bacterium]